MAKGPYAKMMLCWNLLSEFCICEHLAGSMGKAGPPIVSRVIQFLGDGMIFYNHARKIIFILFPFVHDAQLSVLFILVMVPCIAFLMDQYTDEAWLGATLSLSTELENPFRNVPNKLPLVTMQESSYRQRQRHLTANHKPKLLGKMASIALGLGLELLLLSVKKTKFPSSRSN
jgi:hypothetical protein